MENKTTLRQLNELWDSWHKDEEAFKHLRFGQYVFNLTSVETEVSYWIVDPKAAFNNLSAFIEYNHWTF